MSDNLYNLAFEKSLLSSIVFEPSQFDELSKVLKSDDFYLPAHQNIFNTMLVLLKKGSPIDEEFIKSELEKVQKFDAQVMLEILSANPISNTNAYIEEVKNKSQFRELNQVSLDIQKDVLGGIEPSIITYKLIQRLENQSYKATPPLTLQSLGSINAEPTKFILKDWLPLPMDAVTFLTAKGGTGKSFVALQCGLRYLRESPNGKAFLWLSEDIGSTSRDRANLLCIDYGLDAKLIDRLFISTDMPKHFTQVENGKQSVTGVFYEIKKILQDFDFIVFDPLIAFYGGDENNNSQARQFMQEFTKWAIDENKVILFIHHSNKANSGSRGAGAFIDAVRLNYDVEKITNSEDKVLQVNRAFLNFKIAKDNYGASELIGKFEFKREVFPKGKQKIVYEVLNNEKYSTI